jgi:2-octaprenylphenol hydroxylase
VSALEPLETGYRLQLAEGGALSAGLVVGADGAQSRLRQLAALPVREWSYGQRAIVATVAVDGHHRFTAWQRFTDSGPLAFLPLSADGRLCSIVWSQEDAEAERLMALDDDAFRAALGRAFEQRLGEITACSRRVCLPLQQRHAIDYVRPGLALVADAAHTIHPLAGQGINLGIQDVAALAEEVRRGVARGLSPGHEEVLSRYQRRRKPGNLAMMAGMEGFKHLFGHREPAVRWLRNQGLQRMDGLPGLKARVIRHAMGL